MKPEYQTFVAPTVQQVQDETFRVFDTCGTLLVAKRLRVTLTLAAGATRVAHGLKSVPQDITFGVPSALAVVYQSQAPDAQFIYLKTTDDCTVTVWLL
jgi:hypothetical protein